MSSYQTDYDTYRAGIYDQGAAIVARYDASNDVSVKQAALSSLQGTMSGFDTYTKSFLAGYNNAATVSAYVNPRFHDYYDFFQGIITKWQTALAGMVQTTGAVGGSAVASPQEVPIGCTAGICGPVPASPGPSNVLIAVPTGAPNAQGVTSVVTSGGGGTIGSNMPIGAGGLAPSPYTSDLPGTAPPPASPTSNAVLSSGVSGSFDLKTFIKSPLVWAGLGLAAIAFTFRKAK